MANDFVVQNVRNVFTADGNASGVVECATDSGAVRITVPKAMLPAFVAIYASLNNLCHKDESGSGRAFETEGFDVVAHEDGVILTMQLGGGTPISFGIELEGATELLRLLQAAIDTGAGQGSGARRH